MAALPDIDQGHVEGFFTGGLLQALGPDMLREVLAEFRVGQEIKKIEMAKRQRGVGAQENRQSHRMIEGIGQLTMRVDMEAYMLWKLRRPGCWKDKQFRAEFRRDNPECRVNTRVKARVMAPGPLVLAGKYADVGSCSVFRVPPEAANSTGNGKRNTGPQEAAA